MKKLVISLSLAVAAALPVTAQADMKVLVEYEGEVHTVLKTFNISARGMSRQITTDQIAAQKASPDRVPENHIRLSWAGVDGASSILMDDPRLVWAPMGEDGQGHGSAIIPDKGVYLLTLEGDDIQLETLKIAFPGRQAATKINVPLDLD
jgi:hypothetical protein